MPRIRRSLVLWSFLVLFGFAVRTFVVQPNNNVQDFSLILAPFCWVVNFMPTR